jgi:hypothetical protein
MAVIGTSMKLGIINNKRKDWDEFTDRVNEGAMPKKTKEKVAITIKGKSIVRKKKSKKTKSKRKTKDCGCDA